MPPSRTASVSASLRSGADRQDGPVNVGRIQHSAVADRTYSCTWRWAAKDAASIGGPMYVIPTGVLLIGGVLGSLFGGALLAQAIFGGFRSWRARRGDGTGGRGGAPPRGGPAGGGRCGGA